MRMAALSRTTGVPVPTIKFYLREGLLPSGRRTSPNQSQYDERHVRRLELIRTLSDVGGLSLGTIAAVLAAIDNPSQAVDTVLDTVRTALTGTVAPLDAEPGAGHGTADQLMATHGWDVVGNAEQRSAATGLLSRMARMQLAPTPAALDAYAEAATSLAAADRIEAASWPAAERAERLETAVAALVFNDALLAVLRRMAHTAHTAQTAPERPHAGAVGEPDRTG